MKARVFVTLKNGVLDPQGEAIRHALGTRRGVIASSGVGSQSFGPQLENSQSPSSVRSPPTAP